LSRLIVSLSTFCGSQGKYAHVTQASLAALFARLLQAATNHFIYLKNFLLFLKDKPPSMAL
jgi:hypothetical protein